jgi:hypothetical protein
MKQQTERASRFNYMARSRRQGRTLLYPAFPPLTALAPPRGRAIRKARLESAHLVEKNFICALTKEERAADHASCWRMG